MIRYQWDWLTRANCRRPHTAYPHFPSLASTPAFSSAALSPRQHALEVQERRFRGGTSPTPRVIFGRSGARSAAPRISTRSAALRSGSGSTSGGGCINASGSRDAFDGGGYPSGGGADEIDAMLARAEQWVAGPHSTSRRPSGW